jgi:hypothetical protein
VRKVFFAFVLMSCTVAFGASLNVAATQEQANFAIFSKKAHPAHPAPDAAPKEPKLPPADWKGMMPQVRVVVKQTFPKETAEAHYPASISRTVDLTGRGAGEALVDLGSGEYTDKFTVLRMEGNNPVPARFRGKDKDDKAIPRIFLSGMSEGKGEALELKPKDHAVYLGHWMVNGAKVKHCHGEAYAWDTESKSFSLDRKMTKDMTKEFCQRVAADGVKPAVNMAHEDPAKVGSQKLD